MEGITGRAALWPGRQEIGVTQCSTGFLSCYINSSTGAGINDAGVVVGTSTFPESSDNPRAFYWDGSMHNLGTLTGDNRSWASDINESGDIVGYSDRVDGFATAVIWRTGVMEALPKLYQDYPARAYCINDSGIIGGEAANQFSGSSWDAVYWDAAGIHDLGVLGSITDINSHGDMVGSGYVWKDGVRYDPRDWLPPDAGYTRIYPRGINDRGEIAGSGYINGEFHAVILKPVYEISGKVLDDQEIPVEGIMVALDNGESTTSGPDGGYSFRAPEGTYSVTAEKSGYSITPAAHVATVPPAAPGLDFTAILPGDLDRDRDVDGSDLAALATDPGQMDIAAFAAAFGTGS